MLKVYENTVLRRMFIAKRQKLTGVLRKLHSKELHSLCFPLNIVNDQLKEDEMGRSCSKHGENWENETEF
jgi:hypothetical protein